MRIFSNNVEQNFNILKSKYIISDYEDFRLLYVLLFGRKVLILKWNTEFTLQTSILGNGCGHLSI